MLCSLERRKSIRHDFAIRVAIKYSVELSEGSMNDGFLANKSSSGLCLFTSKPHNTGEEIIFKSNTYIPFQRAQVRWVDEVNKKWYAVGLIRNS
jgi:hypothetical protein